MKSTRVTRNGAKIGRAVAQTWQDPEVAAARRKHHEVLVMSGDSVARFHSVRQAFADLGLPLEKHIPFRMSLKANGALMFEHNGVNHRFFLVAHKSKATQAA